MPLYSKKDPYRSMLMELEEERMFTFKGSYILDADEKIGGASKEIERIINKNTKGKPPAGLTKEEAQQELERLSQGIIERLRKANGKFKAFVYSTGGSKSTASDKQNDELKQKGANVEYTVMVLNGVVILEPLGQQNNATYIAEEKEGLEDAITKFGRGEAISSGIIQKVIHDRNERDGYNYGSNHILQLLDYATNNPKELLQVAKENNGCGLKKITQSMPNVVEDIINNVGVAIKDKNIDAKEVAEISEEVENIKKINEKAGKEKKNEKNI